MIPDAYGKFSLVLISLTLWGQTAWAAPEPRLKDFPRYPGSQTRIIKGVTDASTQIITSEDSPDTIAKFYTEKLTSKNWTLDFPSPEQMATWKEAGKIHPDGSQALILHLTYRPTKLNCHIQIARLPNARTKRWISIITLRLTRSGLK